ncbi:hypothetical protein Ae201684P_001033 [Aphanomyces euteiches]|uniref:Uncharacterized protein n=1 Tax=Aphanomyces euteiches TaxID=100861 RepID=A0A6G0WGI4_9STRA|nr:hypothetical protein Ae201684_015463 [Aphanomyces euteiches]KAH9097555.1 hypothetical protein Ae201684P_001033 [Aphanomyces euteiches]
MFMYHGSAKLSRELDIVKPTACVVFKPSYPGVRIERLAEEERKRLEMLCREMAREELLNQEFYREEKRLLVIETRNMQQAEVFLNDQVGILKAIIY